MEEENKQVVGIKYTPGEGLPRVILKGKGHIADEILRKRNLNNGQSVIRNRDLVKKLYRLPIDAEITRDLYEIVATVLAHVFSVNQKLKDTTNERYIFRDTGGDAE